MVLKRFFGGPVSSDTEMTAIYAERRVAGGNALLIDVREPGEWRQGHARAHRDSPRTGTAFGLIGIGEALSGAHFAALITVVAVYCCARRSGLRDRRHDPVSRLSTKMRASRA